MPSRMDRLSGAIGRHRRLILAAWALAFLLALPLSMRQTDRLTEGGFDAPGSGSFAVDRQFGQFKANDGPNAAAVLVASSKSHDGALRVAVARARRIATTVDGVRVALPQARRRPAAMSLVPLVLGGGFDQRVDEAAKLRDALGVGTPKRGVEVHLVGQDALWAALHDLQKRDLSAAERIGFPITLLILLAVFGSLAAAALPIALAAVSVTLTGAAVYFLSGLTEMSVFVTNAASMLGIGVAIDYSLFVLARYRQEISGGSTADEARRIALRTSGRAVVFSGVTVIVSLLGIFLVDSTIMRSMALGVIVVVAISVLGTVTLLPALISLLGRRAYSPGRVRAIGQRLRHALGQRPANRDFWSRWTELVTRKPALSLVCASSLMLILAIPALSIHLSDSALGQFPRQDQTRVAAKLAARTLGLGELAPIETIAEFRVGSGGDNRNRRTLARYLAFVRRRAAVASVTAPRLSSDGHLAQFSIVPRTGPDNPATRRLLASLQHKANSGQGLAAAASIEFGGPTALTKDFAGLISASMWKIGLFIVGASYLILMAMLRSVLLPLKAVFMTLLSVAAAYGVLVAVFQWGWFAGFLGYDPPGYVGAIVPPLLLAMVFGLSMDYEVFLLTRIREALGSTDDHRGAIARGLRASAGTITSAALIMVSVFLVFAAVSVPSIQQIGLGLAVAIALDATVVRLILVPATMELLGRWNWWFPRTLERHLPPLAYDSPPTIRFTGRDVISGDGRRQRPSARLRGSSTGRKSRTGGREPDDDDRA